MPPLLSLSVPINFRSFAEFPGKTHQEEQLNALYHGQLPEKKGIVT